MNLWRAGDLQRSARDSSRNSVGAAKPFLGPSAGEEGAKRGMGVDSAVLAMTDRCAPGSRSRKGDFVAQGVAVAGACVDRHLVQGRGCELAMDLREGRGVAVERGDEVAGHRGEMRRHVRRGGAARGEMGSSVGDVIVTE